MNILEQIAGKTRERIDQEKGKVSVAELKERIRDREQNPAILPTLSFYQALKKEGSRSIGDFLSDRTVLFSGIRPVSGRDHSGSEYSGTPERFYGR